MNDVIACNDAVFTHFEVVDGQPRDGAPVVTTDDDVDDNGIGAQPERRDGFGRRDGLLRARDDGEGGPQQDNGRGESAVGQRHLRTIGTRDKGQRKSH